MSAGPRTADTRAATPSGGRFVVHHMIWSTYKGARDAGGRHPDPRPSVVTWPVHEVGREPDIFDNDAGRLLRAGSSIVSNSLHLHSNGRDTRAHLEIGFRFHPPDYRAEVPPHELSASATAADIDIRAGEAGQELHAYQVLNQHTKIVTFEPHLHAPGMRMCLEAIWGFNVETINCVGYDHNWVRGYTYEQDHQPLLPEGTDPAHHRLHGHFRSEPECAGHPQLAGLGQPLGGEHVHRSGDAGRRSRTSSSSRRWPGGGRTLALGPERSCDRMSALHGDPGERESGVLRTTGVMRADRARLIAVGPGTGTGRAAKRGARPTDG